MYRWQPCDIGIHAQCADANIYIYRERKLFGKKKVNGLDDRNSHVVLRRDFWRGIGVNTYYYNFVYFSSYVFWHILKAFLFFLLCPTTTCKGDWMIYQSTLTRVETLNRNFAVTAKVVAGYQTKRQWGEKKITQFFPARKRTRKIIYNATNSSGMTCAVMTVGLWWREQCTGPAALFIFILAYREDSK